MTIIVDNVRVCMGIFTVTGGKNTVKFSVQTSQLTSAVIIACCLTTYFAETCHQLASLSLSRFPTLSYERATILKGLQVDVEDKDRQRCA